MIQIRRTNVTDLEDLYSVCLRTGDSGADATEMHAYPTLLGEVYVGPYVMLDSAFGFTATHNASPVGYALAVPNTRIFERDCERNWWPELRTKYSDLSLEPLPADRWVIERIQNPPTVPDTIIDRYPAHLHIDLLPLAQGSGAGRALLTELLTGLCSRGASGVHLDVDPKNETAIGFYEHLGYETLIDRTDERIMGMRLAGS